ncbi:MAG: DUF4251 domain-containing protein [Bacteroidota bacterium]
MKKLRNCGLLLLTLIAFNAAAQTDKATTQKIVEDKDFIFVATMAIPLNTRDVNSVLSKIPGNGGAGSISLSGSGYNVQVKSDSLVVYLPYYGRAYSAPINSDDSGYKFTAKKFTYENSKRKKGGWEINITTKDVKENPRLNFTISTNGYATLMITSNNKQSITYNGYLSEPKKPAF